MYKIQLVRERTVKVFTAKIPIFYFIQKVMYMYVHMYNAVHCGLFVSIYDVSILNIGSCNMCKFKEYKYPWRCLYIFEDTYMNINKIQSTSKVYILNIQ